MARPAFTRTYKQILASRESLADVLRITPKAVTRLGKNGWLPRVEHNDKLLYDLEHSLHLARSHPDKVAKAVAFVGGAEPTLEDARAELAEADADAAD